MRYELWSDGVLAGEFSSLDDGHAIVRGYRMVAGMGNTLYAVMDGAHDRKAVQHVLYKGKVFAYTVACGCRQFAAADPKDVHKLGIPQDLRRVVPRAGRAGE